MNIREHNDHGSVEQLDFIDGDLLTVGDSPGDGASSHKQEFEEVQSSHLLVLSRRDVVHQLLESHFVIQNQSHLRHILERTILKLIIDFHIFI